jgi:hypothetical protein
LPVPVPVFGFVDVMRPNAICAFACVDVRKPYAICTSEFVDVRKLYAICTSEFMDVRKPYAICTSESVDARKLYAIWSGKQESTVGSASHMRGKTPTGRYFTKSAFGCSLGLAPTNKTIQIQKSRPGPPRTGPLFFRQNGSGYSRGVARTDKTPKIKKSRQSGQQVTCAGRSSRQDVFENMLLGVGKA